MDSLIWSSADVMAVMNAPSIDWNVMSAKDKQQLRFHQRTQTDRQINSCPSPTVVNKYGGVRPRRKQWQKPGVWFLEQVL